MIKTEIKYGLLTGFGICLWIIAEYLLNLHDGRMYIGRYTTYIAVIVPFITFYFGIREKRDKVLEGNISLKDGILAGLMISLISSIIITLFLIVYLNNINPDFIQQSINFQKEQLQQSGKSDVEIAFQVEDIKSAFSFINQILFGALGTLSTGILISIFVSLHLKKKSIAQSNLI